MTWYTMSDDQRRRAIAVANQHRVTCRDFAEALQAKYWTVKDWASRRGLGFNGRAKGAGGGKGAKGPKDIGRFERVKALAEQGLSAEKIRGELRLESRSVVIGLCARHGVQLRGRGGGRQSGAGRPRRLERHDTIVRRMHAGGASDTLIAEVLITDRKTVARYREKLGLPANKQPAPKKAPPAPPPNSGQALFLDVIETRARCRWIDGDPRAAPIEQLRCCGAPVSKGSYCEYHAAVINGIAATFPSPNATRRPGGTDTATRAARPPSKRAGVERPGATQAAAIEQPTKPAPLTEQEAWTGRP